MNYPPTPIAKGIFPLVQNGETRQIDFNSLPYITPENGGNISLARQLGLMDDIIPTLEGRVKNPNFQAISKPNIIPSPSLRNETGFTTQRLNHGYEDNVSSVPLTGLMKNVKIKGETLTNIAKNKTLKNTMNNVKTQSMNNQHGGVSIVDGEFKKAKLGGQTLISIGNLKENTVEKEKTSDYETSMTLCSVTFNHEVFNRKLMFRFNLSLPTNNNYTGSLRFYKLNEDGSTTYKTSKEIEIMKNGVHHVIAETGSLDTRRGINYVELQIKSKEEGNYTVSDFIVLEYQDGMENWDIPYFEGIAHVTSPTVTTRGGGKNLFNVNNLTGLNDGITVNNGAVDFGSGGSYDVSQVAGLKEKLFGRLEAGKTYYFSANTTETFSMSIFLKRDRGDGWTQTLSFRINSSITIPDEWEDFKVTDIMGKGTYSNLQIEEGTIPTFYEPYSDVIKTHTTYTPSNLTLKGLPNGVTDELNLMTGTITRRIGESVLNGSEDWRLVSDWSTGDYCVLYATFNANSYVIIDKFLNNFFNKDSVSVSEGFMFDGQDKTLFLSIAKAKASTLDEFKVWLQLNPMTVFYDLATPTYETVQLTSKPMAYTNGVIELNANTIYPSVKYEVATNNSYSIDMKPNTEYTFKSDNKKELIINGVVVVDEKDTNPMILEGNHLNRDLPYFTGTKSVVAPSVTITGSNLFDIVTFFTQKANFTKNSTTYTGSILNLKNKNITITGGFRFKTQYYIATRQKSQNSKPLSLKITYTDGTNMTLDLTSSQSYIGTNITTTANKTISNIRFECSEDDTYTFNSLFITEYPSMSTSVYYEEYKVATPSELVLRSVGDSYDTLDLVHGAMNQRIGELPLRGWEDWMYLPDASTGDTALFVLQDFIYEPKDFTKYASDSLPYFDGDILNVEERNDEECFKCFFNRSGDIDLNTTIITSIIYISISKDKASTLEEFKTYLESNPITIYYELFFELNYPVTSSDSTIPPTPIPFERTSNINDVTFDGSDDENWYLRNDNKYAIELWNFSSLKNVIHDGDKNYGFSINRDSNIGTIYINYVFNSKEEFKQYLQDNPLTVIYETTNLPSTSAMSEQLLCFSNGYIHVTSNGIIPIVSYEVPSLNSYHVDMLDTNKVYTLRYFKKVNGNFELESESTFKGELPSPWFVTQGITPMMIEHNWVGYDLPYFKGFGNAVNPVATINGKNKWSNKLFDIFYTSKNTVKLETMDNRNEFTHTVLSSTGNAEWAYTKFVPSFDIGGYVLSLEATANSSLGETVDILYGDADDNLINVEYSYDVSVGGKVNFLIPNEAVSIYFFVIAYNTSVAYTIKNLMITEKNSNYYLEYQPYVEPQIVETLEDVTMRGIGGVEFDYLDITTGELTQNIKEFVIDNLDNYIGYNRNYDGLMLYYFENKDMKYTSIQASNVKNMTSIPTEEVSIIGQGTNIILKFPKSMIANSIELGYWLKENPVTVQYVSKTPITRTVKLSNYELNTMYQFSRVKGTSDVMSCWINGKFPTMSLDDLFSLLIDGSSVSTMSDTSSTSNAATSNFNSMASTNANTLSINTDNQILIEHEELTPKEIDSEELKLS